jgi:hypothetical protein
MINRSAWAQEMDFPFAAPPDSADIVLDLPVPPSVNRTRKIHWRGNKKLTDWHDKTDTFILFWKQRNRLPETPIERFELHVIGPEQGCDFDNLKAVADYLKRIEVIADDSRRHMCRLVFEVGDVPVGQLRVTVRPIG